MCKPCFYQNNVLHRHSRTAWKLMRHRDSEYVMVTKFLFDVLVFCLNMNQTCTPNALREVVLAVSL